MSPSLHRFFQSRRARVFSDRLLGLSIASYKTLFSHYDIKFEATEETLEVQRTWAVRELVRRNLVNEFAEHVQLMVQSEAKKSDETPLKDHLAVLESDEFPDEFEPFVALTKRLIQQTREMESAVEDLKARSASAERNSENPGRRLLQLERELELLREEVSTAKKTFSEMQKGATTRAWSFVGLLIAVFLTLAFVDASTITLNLAASIAFSVIVLLIGVKLFFGFAGKASDAVEAIDGRKRAGREEHDNGIE